MRFLKMKKDFVQLCLCLSFHAHRTPKVLGPNHAVSARIGSLFSIAMKIYVNVVGHPPSASGIKLNRTAAITPF